MREVAARKNSKIKMILVNCKRDTPHMTMIGHIHCFSSVSTETDVDAVLVGFYWSQQQLEKSMGLYWSQQERTLMIVSGAAGEDDCDCIGRSGSGSGRGCS